MDYYPNEADQALSLAQKAYVSTMCCWKDPKHDAAVDKWLLDAYTKADQVSCGVYVADFNVKHRKPKVSQVDAEVFMFNADSLKGYDRLCAEEMA
jgi:hypothetical protein